MNDFLDEALRHLRPARAAYCRCELGRPWALDLAREPGMRLHFMAAGQCGLRVGGATWLLGEGDVALVPHGTGHVLADPPGTPATPLERLDRRPVGADAYRLQAGGSGGRTLMFCCAIEFDAVPAHALLAAMPEVLHVRRTRERDPALAATLDEMTHEVGCGRLGSAAVMARLADVAVVRLLRLWLEAQGPAPQGWLAAVRDPEVGRALAAMHRRPGAAWSVEALARAAGMSRSVFCARFVALLGESPGRYVSRWRAALAHGLLRGTRLTMAEIAEQLGYESDASFSRAFKRIVGQPPSAIRAVAAAGS